MSACYIQVSTFCQDFENTFPINISYIFTTANGMTLSQQCLKPKVNIYFHLVSINTCTTNMWFGKLFFFQEALLVRIFQAFLELFYLWELLWREAHLTSVKGLPLGPSRGFAPVPYWAAPRPLPWQGPQTPSAIYFKNSPPTFNWQPWCIMDWDCLIIGNLFTFLWY